MDLTAAGPRLTGISQYAHEAGWILDAGLFAFLNGPHREYLTSIEFDGILSSIRKSETVFREIVNDTKVPVVDLGQTCPEVKLPRVFPDHKAAGRVAANHLLELGLRHLYFYSHVLEHPAVRLRRDGFREVALARGARVDELWWDSSKPLSGGLTRLNWLIAQFRSCDPPIGVLAGSDLVSADVLDAATRAGLRIPEDVAVIGVDNDPIITELGLIPLTSVDTARERVGYEAAALLDRLINGERAPRNPILVEPAGVVTRRSTEMLAVADPDLIKAIRFIQDNFRNPITVADVAATSFLSRRMLQDRFLQALGHGMLDEITRQRLEFCKHLLTQTTHKISSIATVAGFGDLNRMGKAFKRKLGTTPREYRETYQQVFAANQS